MRTLPDHRFLVKSLFFFLFFSLAILSILTQTFHFFPSRRGDGRILQQTAASESRFDTATLVTRDFQDISRLLRCFRSPRIRTRGLLRYHDNGKQHAPCLPTVGQKLSIPPYGRGGPQTFYEVPRPGGRTHCSSSLLLVRLSGTQGSSGSRHDTTSRQGHTQKVIFQTISHVQFKEKKKNIPDVRLPFRYAENRNFSNQQNLRSLNHSVHSNKNLIASFPWWHVKLHNITFFLEAWPFYAFRTVRRICFIALELKIKKTENLVRKLTVLWVTLTQWSLRTFINVIEDNNEMKIASTGSSSSRS